MPLYEVKLCTQLHKIVLRTARVFVVANSEDFVVLACTISIGLKGVTAERTDRHMPKL